MNRALLPQALSPSTKTPQNEKVLNQWFIRLRWIAVATALILVHLTIKTFHYLDPAVYRPLLLLIGVLAASNLLYTWWLHSGRGVRFFREIQISSDLILLALMLHYSGGIENPLSFLFIFHIILSGILLSRKKCYQVVAFSFLLYASLAFCELYEVVPHYTLRIFPHTPEKEHHAHEGHSEEIAIHAAHHPVYVYTLSGLQFFVMLLTAYFITTVMDRLRKQQELTRAQQQRLERVLEATGAGAIILNRNLRAIWFNEPIYSWLGLKGLDLSSQQKVILDWIGGPSGPASKTLKDGQVRQYEREKVLPDQLTHYFQVTLAPLRNEAGEIYQVVELVQDVTEKKILEAEMIHAARMVTLGTMAAGIAHEVGNPLASITTRLLLMESESNQQFIQESIPLLRKEIARIERIVRGIAQFGRPSRERWEKCNLNQILQETIEILKYHKLARNRKLQTRLSPDLPAVLAVADQLKQVFLNIGLNALEAMSDGGTLLIETRRKGPHLLVQFTDTGCGMSREVQQKIFQPFFTTKQEGTGLGLFIAQHIIQAHGGNISVESTPGQGSRFTIILPVRIQQQRDV